MRAALRLYRHLALFVAENFQHMHIEETVNNAALWACYSDAELLEIHGRLLASMPPQEHLLVARWMVPALSPVERAGMLNGGRPDAARKRSSASSTTCGRTSTRAAGPSWRAPSASPASARAGRRLNAPERRATP